jgi:uncharacterized damage-inducible protein DinB
MIGVDHVRTMARYNAWQNSSLYREASALGEQARRAALSSPASMAR